MADMAQAEGRQVQEAAVLPVEAKVLRHCSVPSLRNMEAMTPELEATKTLSDASSTGIA